MTVQLRKTPTQTAFRHSASLPVHEMVFCSLLMTLSATSNGDFPHNVIGWEHAPCMRAVKPTLKRGNGWPEHAESVPGGMHAA